jgi:hypothetical protein
MVKISKTHHRTKKGIIKRNPLKFEDRVATAISWKGGIGSSWEGSPMMKPNGEIGIVIKDDNWGTGRTLSVEFKDHKEDLHLINIGGNPPKSQKWKWLHHRPDGNSMWVEWGY